MQEYSKRRRAAYARDGLESEANISYLQTLRSSSHEWIYNYVLADFYGGGALFTHLRHRLIRYKEPVHKQRDRILGRSSIHDRPAIIDELVGYGDRETGTVIGKRGTSAIVTLLERKSRFYLLKKVTSKHADAIAEATRNAAAL